MTVLFFLILIVLAAILGDHYSRLKKMGWAPEVEPYRQGRSILDPIGGALGELGRADGPFKLIAGLFDMIAKVTEMVYAPIAALLGGIGKGMELILKPIGAVLSAMTGFGLTR